MKKYFVMTNGLSGDCLYEANNPDEALTYAQEHERFLRIMYKYPQMSPAFAGRVAKDELYLPDFRIACCILHNER